MAKRDRKPQPEQTPAEPRRHRRLRQREAEIQRRVMLILGAAIGLVVIVLAYGAINEFVLKPRRPIAVVNGEAISTSAFQRRLRFEQDNLVSQINQYIQFGQQFSTDGTNPFDSLISQLFGDLATPESFSLTVVDRMVEETVVRQLAVEHGVSVSEDDVQLELEKQFGYDRAAPPPPTPDPTSTVTETVPAETTVTAEDFRQRYDDTIAALKDRDSLTEAEFRDVARLQLLRDGLEAVAPLEFNTVEEQVKASHILFRIEAADTPAEKADADALAKIMEARARIEAGENFADVAAEVSDDPGSAANGGDLGTFGRGAMVPEFEDAAFSLAVGELSQPVKTDFGYHLILVEEKDEANEQVHARHILARIDTSPSAEAVAEAEAVALSEASAAKARIEAGEAFADVAAELSADAATAEQGGDLGWFWRDNAPFGTEFADAAFALTPGQVSDPVKTSNGYHLILVEEKDKAREVDENEMQQRRSTAFDEWITAQVTAADTQTNWSLDAVPALPSDLQDVVNSLRGASAPAGG